MIFKTEGPFLWNKQTINYLPVPAISHMPLLTAADPQSRGFEGLGFKRPHGFVSTWNFCSGAGVPLTEHKPGRESKLWLHF